MSRWMFALVVRWRILVTFPGLVVMKALRLSAILLICAAFLSATCYSFGHGLFGHAPGSETNMSPLLVAFLAVMHLFYLYLTVHHLVFSRPLHRTSYLGWLAMVFVAVGYSALAVESMTSLSDDKRTIWQIVGYLAFVITYAFQLALLGLERQSNARQNDLLYAAPTKLEWVQGDLLMLISSIAMLLFVAGGTHWAQDLPLVGSAAQLLGQWRMTLREHYFQASGLVLKDVLILWLLFLMLLTHMENRRRFKSAFKSIYTDFLKALGEPRVERKEGGAFKSLDLAKVSPYVQASGPVRVVDFACSDGKRSLAILDYLGLGRAEVSVLAHDRDPKWGKEWRATRDGVLQHRQGVGAASCDLRFSSDVKELLRELDEAQIFIASHMMGTFRLAATVVECVRRLPPGAMVVIRGPGPTSFITHASMICSAGALAKERYLWSREFLRRMELACHLEPWTGGGSGFSRVPDLRALSDIDLSLDNRVRCIELVGGLYGNRAEQILSSMLEDLAETRLPPTIRYEEAIYLFKKV